jgi:hypothetical protein
VYKVSHPKLEEMKVIEWVDPGVSKTLKKCSYKFTHGKHLHSVVSVNDDLIVQWVQTHFEWKYI